MALEHRLRRLEGHRSGACLTCTFEALNAATDGTVYEKPERCTHTSVTSGWLSRALVEIDDIVAAKRDGAE